MEISVQPHATPLSLSDLTRFDGFSRREVDLAHTLHERLARILTANISAVLRFSLHFRVERLEQTSFDAVLQQRAETDCLFYVRCQNERAGAIIFTAALAQPLLELILGGSPLATTSERTLTEVELSLLADLAQQLRSEWEGMWQAYVPVSMALDWTENSRSARGDSAVNTEQVLLVTMPVQGEGIEGEVRLALKVRLLNQLRQTEDEKRKQSQRSADPERRAQIVNRLQECIFPVQVVVPAGTSRFGELARLQSGDLLVFDASVDLPAQAKINGINKFSGELVQVGDMRAFLIHSLAGTDPAARGGAPNGRARVERRRFPRETGDAASKALESAS